MTSRRAGAVAGAGRVLVQADVPDAERGEELLEEGRCGGRC